MPKNKHPGPSKMLGMTLRTWREFSGMSMRQVARASAAHPVPIAFDYLSRLERGDIMPSLPKLATLAAVYGRPLMELIDLYEIEQLRHLVPRRTTYEVCHKLGNESLERGEVTKAIACFLGALDAAKRAQADRGPLPDAKKALDDRERLAIANLNVGNAIWRSGRHIMAREYLEEGLRLAESPLTRASLLNILTIVHFHLDNTIVADALSQAAQPLAAADPVLLNNVLAYRALVLLALKRYDEAEQLLRQVIRAFEERGDHVAAVYRILNLGYGLVDHGKSEEGLVHLLDGVKRADLIGNAHLIACGVLQLGRAFVMVGRNEEARPPFERALRVATREGFRDIVFHSAFYLWKLARERGEEAEAAEFEAISRAYRVRLEKRTEEAQEFDLWMTRRHRRPGRRARK